MSQDNKPEQMEVKFQIHSHYFKKFVREYNFDFCKQYIESIEWNNVNCLCIFVVRKK